MFAQTQRLGLLPKYLFAQIDELKQQIKAKGVDIIDLGIGDPDLPTPQPIIEALCQAANDPQNHRYPSYEGMLSFRQAAADWYWKRFNVALNSKNEVLSLIGSKEGIAHLPLAFVNPGDVVLVPSPGYPVYQASTILAGGTPYEMPLPEANNFLPDLEGIPVSVLKQARIMFLNYPNNPTAAVADAAFYAKAIQICREHNIILAHDAAYSELAFDGYRPMSILEMEGAKDVAVEFHSLSKTFNMTGWRIGFAVGNAEILAGLGKVKTNIDSGIFQAVQYAGIMALADADVQADVDKSVKIYQGRRDVLVEGLKRLGFRVDPPKATFYVWTAAPANQSSAGFCARLLQEAGIVITPGVGFGKYGEGYIRFALTVSEERMQEALHRLSKLGF